MLGDAGAGGEDLTMNHPLSRLFRLRSLLEDISRMELEAQLQEAARIESALAQLEENDRAMRRQAFEGIVRAENADRVVAESIREWTGWKRSLLKNVRERKLAEVSAAKSVYLERRKECGQVRSVIENEDAAAALKRARREQQELDDWFGQRNGSGRPASDSSKLVRFDSGMPSARCNAGD